MEKSKVIENLFYKILTYSYLLLPLSLLFIGQKKRKAIPLIIGLYGIVCFLFLFYYDAFPKHLYKYFLSGYTLFEYSIFTFIFWKNFSDRKVKYSILIASVLFFVFQVLYVVSGNVRRLDTVPIGIETILMLTYIIYFFLQFSKNVETSFISNQYLFWIAVGILIYLGGSFFFFILINHLSDEQVNTFGLITYIAEIIKNILFVFGIFIYAKNKIENQSRNSVPYLDMI